MGYRIDYQSVSEAKKTAKRHYPALILFACLAALLILNTALKDLRAVFLKIIFPGDLEVTAASLETMLHQLKSGTPFSDALLVFCQQVTAG